MKNRHRIEFLFRTPSGEMETLTLTLEANGHPAALGIVAKRMRCVLEEVMEPEKPLILEHTRDYALPAEPEPVT